MKVLTVDIGGTFIKYCYRWSFRDFSSMYLRASNGVYFEVGGTTTNIGVIKNGIHDVGPRSTHIAGMDYAVFTGVLLLKCGMTWRLFEALCQ